jgi:RES domain-containing protein
LRLWRIAGAAWPVWSSEGARLKGGRWNRPGTPAIYAATSYAGAVLEILVHANIGRVPAGFRYVAIDIPDDAPVDRLEPAEVPGWDGMPPFVARQAGETWLQAATGLVLLVPSAVTNGLDSNALINPLHRDFARIAVSEERPALWDPRVLGDSPSPPRRGRRGTQVVRPEVIPP